MRPLPHRAAGKTLKARFLFIPFAVVVLVVVPARAQRFVAETFSLDNGMQVVVAPNHRAPAVTQMVWYLSLIHI